MIVLGSSPEADVFVNDDYVSRRHAVVWRAMGSVIIQDLGSINGTWVNGARISADTTLQPGDELRLGHTAVVMPTYLNDVNWRPTV